MQFILSDTLPSWGQLAVTVLLGFGVYAGAATALGAVRRQDLRQALRRS